MAPPTTPPETTVSFAKYHGLGNDFIILDRRQGDSDSDSDSVELSPETVRALCDRHRGIGADGVLTIWRDPDSAVHARMQVQNADGSDASMCGNGLRCVAQFLFDTNTVAGLGNTHAQGSNQAGPPTLTLTAGAGSPSGKRSPNQAFTSHQATSAGPCIIQITMGQAHRRHRELPNGAHADSDQVTLDVSPNLHQQTKPWPMPRHVVGTALHLGNPHVVLYAGDLVPAAEFENLPAPEVQSKLGQLAAQAGPALESHPAFANRTNVAFVWPTPTALETVVYERGVGITQACGSGACAVAVAAIRRAFWGHPQPTTSNALSVPTSTSGDQHASAAVQVYLPGGPLTITVDEQENLTMSGEALHVFTGTTTLPSS